MTVRLQCDPLLEVGQLAIIITPVTQACSEKRKTNAAMMYILFPYLFKKRKAVFFGGKEAKVRIVLCLL